jgi:hypothetical protein
MVLQAELPRQVRRHSRRAIALCGVMAAGQVGHSALARIVGLGFGYLSGNEGIGPRRDGRFEVTLSATAAPRYIFDSFLRSIHKGYWPIYHRLDVRSEG